MVTFELMTFITLEEPFLYFNLHHHFCYFVMKNNRLKIRKLSHFGYYFVSFSFCVFHIFIFLSFEKLQIFFSSLFSRSLIIFCTLLILFYLASNCVLIQIIHEAVFLRKIGPWFSKILAFDQFLPPVRLFYPPGH